MEFIGQCVYLGINDFISKKTGEVYYLLKLHLPSGDVQDFFIDEKLFKSLNLNLYENVNVNFKMTSYNKQIQVSVTNLSKIEKKVS